jgi:predicted DCC family thiol-disulfide oxidoreductase YuxK
MLIIYDGDCPFCRAYTRLLRLQQAAGVICLLNAREPDPRIHYYVTLGYDLNEGMLVVIEDRIYAGAEAMQVLAACSSRSDLFNRLHYAIFSRAALATRLYPALRLGRRLVLYLLGRSPIPPSPLR